MNYNYLIHYNHNHDRLGRFARSTGAAASAVGSKITNKKKKAPPAADIKRGKAANTKLSEADRNRLVKSGSAKEIAKYKDRLSNRELESAIDRLQKEKIQRIDLEKKLTELNTTGKQKRTALEKIEKYSNDLERLSNAAEKAAKMYNTAAKIHNVIASGSDQWPIYGEKKKGPKEYTPEEKALADRGLRLKEYNLETKEIKAQKERHDVVSKPAQSSIDTNKYFEDLATSSLARKQAEKNLRDFDRKENATKSADKPKFYTTKNSSDNSSSAAKTETNNQPSSESSVTEPEPSSNSKSASKPTFVYNNNSKAAQEYVKNNYDTMLSDVVGNSGYSEYFDEVEKRKIKYR